MLQKHADKSQEKRKRFGCGNDKKNRTGLYAVLIILLYFTLDARFDLGIFSLNRNMDKLYGIPVIKGVFNWINTLEPEILRLSAVMLLVCITTVIFLGGISIAFKSIAFLIKQTKSAK